MQTAIDLIVAVAVVYLIVDTVRTFLSSAGTIWQRLWAAARHSATVLWARFVVAVAAGVDALVWLADIAGSPGVAAAIQQYLSPSVVAGVMIAIAVIAELARRRTLANPRS
jgi:hypothetical protein